MNPSTNQGRERRRHCCSLPGFLYFWSRDITDTQITDESPAEDFFQSAIILLLLVDSICTLGSLDFCGSNYLHIFGLFFVSWRCYKLKLQGKEKKTSPVSFLDFFSEIIMLPCVSHFTDYQYSVLPIKQLYFIHPNVRLIVIYSSLSILMEITYCLFKPFTSGSWE